jgi:hypothetical protein
MNNKILNGLIAGALGATLALASPALAFHGGGGGGGMHGGGMGGGMHGGGMGGGMHVGGMSGTHFGGMGGRAHFSGSRFAGGHFVHAGFSPRFSGFAFRHGAHFRHHAFFHHRFHRFAFVGVPFAYAAYDSCWRRAWTPYGLQWVNVCGDYSY